MHIWKLVLFILLFEQIYVEAIRLRTIVKLLNSTSKQTMWFGKAASWVRSCCFIQTVPPLWHIHMVWMNAVTCYLCNRWLDLLPLEQVICDWITNCEQFWDPVIKFCPHHWKCQCRDTTENKPCINICLKHRQTISKPHYDLGKYRTLDFSLKKPQNILMLVLDISVLCHFNQNAFQIKRKLVYAEKKHLLTYRKNYVFLEL